MTSDVNAFTTGVVIMPFVFIGTKAHPEDLSSSLRGQ